jgi:5-methylthioadenosine/S-adenosylhomocysteine deaminase
MSSIKITNANIVTLNKEFEVLNEAEILIEDGRIKAIGKSISAHATSVYDANGKWLMPGFINTHTHLPMTIFRGIADDLPFDQWLFKKIWPAEKKFLNHESIRIGSELGVLEMIQSGTTTFNDMYFFSHTIAEVVEKAKIRGFIGESVVDFPTHTYANLEEALSLNVDLAEKYNDHPYVRPSISAHAPYSCSPETLQEVKAVADRFKMVYNIHISETKKEVEESIEKVGKRPVEYLNSLGVLDKSTVGAHCVWLSEEEVKIYKNSGAHVSHNPSSNLKLACGFAPIHTYLKEGINVAIGTDGAASNNNTDLLEEMRLSTLIHKGTSFDPTVLNANTSLQMVTQNGARALGMEKELGSLEVGKIADLLIIDLKRPATTPIYDVHSTLVYAAHSGQIQSVMINGEFVMKDRQMLTLDEEGIKAEAQELANKIKKEV